MNKQKYVGEVTHSYTGTKLHMCWKNMKTRCYNKNGERYPHYGAKGITVCDDWLIFNNFKNWAESNGYSEDLTIDRINPELGYEPSNCRWLTYEENHALMMLHNLQNNTGIFSEKTKLKSKLALRSNFGKTTYIEKDGEILQFGKPTPTEFRVLDGVAHRMDRLKALGNGQVPIVAASAWCELHKSVIQ